MERATEHKVRSLYVEIGLAFAAFYEVIVDTVLRCQLSSALLAHKLIVLGDCLLYGKSLGRARQLFKVSRNGPCFYVYTQIEDRHQVSQTKHYYVEQTKVHNLYPI